MAETSYILVRANQTPIVVDPETTNNTSTSLALVGRSFENYGEPFAQNFVDLLNNFAKNAPAEEDYPSNPIQGQLFYNTGDSTLYVNQAATDGDTSGWAAVGGGGGAPQELTDYQDEIDSAFGLFINNDGTFDDVFNGQLFDITSPMTNLHDVFVEIDALIPRGLDDLDDPIDTSAKADTYVLTYDSGSGGWIAAPPTGTGGGGSGDYWGADGPTYQTTGAFVGNYDQNYLIDTTAGAVACALPPGIVGDIGKTIGFVDVAGKFGITGNLTLDPAPGDKMMGVTDDIMTVSTQYASVRIVWAGDAFGWRLVT